MLMMVQMQRRDADDGADSGGDAADDTAERISSNSVTMPTYHSFIANRCIIQLSIVITVNNDFRCSEPGNHSIYEVLLQQPVLVNPVIILSARFCCNNLFF